MKAKDTFKIGKHDIGFVGSFFLDKYGEEEVVEPGSVGPFSLSPTFQTFPRYMNDSEIEAELKPGKCTLGDVLAFLKNPPEGTKDGNYNVFYVGGFVVSADWRADDGYWYVGAWDRGVVWPGGSRFFSPASASVPTDSALKPSEPMPSGRPLERYAIEIETKGDYEHKKEFSLVANMSARDYIALCDHLLTFFERTDNTAQIEPEARK